MQIQQKQKIEELEKELEKYRPKEVCKIDTSISPTANVFMRETSLMY